ncbi:hypothetical protein [Nostoc sp.]
MRNEPQRTRSLPYRLWMNSDHLKKSGNDAIAIHAKVTIEAGVISVIACCCSLHVIWGKFDFGYNFGYLSYSRQQQGKRISNGIDKKYILCFNDRTGIYGSVYF